MIRQPVVSGKFYPQSPSELRQMLAGMVDEKAEKEDVVGLVLPHAGYIYSGPVAGATISRVKFGQTFIILGPSHTGRGQPFSIMTDGAWRTPLGDVDIDTGLADKLLATSRYLEQDDEAHRYEHSIEVQLPWLQFFKPDIKLVPIVLAAAASTVYREIGREIAMAIKALNRKVVIIASSDMTHYEPQDSARMKDSQAMEAILALDDDELIRRVRELNISMCGYAPVISLIVATRELGAGAAEIVKYQTSGDTSGDYSSVVGYAGIIIKSAGMSPQVELARKAVETYVNEGKSVQPPDELSPQMAARAGVFVSLHKFGQLRGCIGTFEPTRQNITQEIIANAIS